MTEDKYLYTSAEVANYIVAFANERKYTINMTKLQKLLYIAYGACLAIKKTRLTNEYPKAWPYGPVFPVVRDNFMNVVLDEITMDLPLLSEIKEDTFIKDLINFVFEGFAGRTSQELSAWSQKKNSPWYDTTMRSNFTWGDQIIDQDITKYFKSIIKRKE